RFGPAAASPSIVRQSEHRPLVPNARKQGWKRTRASRGRRRRARGRLGLRRDACPRAPDEIPGNSLNVQLYGPRPPDRKRFAIAGRSVVQALGGAARGVGKALTTQPQPTFGVHSPPRSPRRSAGLFRPAAIVVPRSPVPRQSILQSAGGDSAEGS